MGANSNPQFRGRIYDHRAKRGPGGSQRRESNFSSATLDTIGSAGSLTLSSGRSFTTLGAFTNSGQLILGPASTLTVNGSFSQTATGTWIDQIGGTSLQPTVGAIVVSPTGTVTLDGLLKLTSSIVPVLNALFDIINNQVQRPSAAPSMAWRMELPSPSVSCEDRVHDDRLPRRGWQRRGDNPQVLVKNQKRARPARAG